MKRYNVLWLEDEIEKVEAFIDLAGLGGIDLDQVDTVSEFKAKLNKDISLYDAAILDAQGVNDSSEEHATLNAVLNAIEAINELKSQKVLPYFILSGQLGEGENQSAKELLGKDKIYIKSRDEDRLLIDVVNAADQQEDTQIRHKYHRVFEVCTEKYIGEKNKGALLNLLLFLNSNEVYDEEKLNSIRKIFEAVLYGCKRKGLIHDKCYNDGKLNITAALKFLTGEKTYVPNYKSYKFILQGPECMSEFIYSMASHIREVTNAGSHFEDDIQVDESEKIKSKLKLSMLTQQVSSPYLVKSLIYELCDLLLWFKSYVDENPDFNTSKSRWNDLTQRKLDTPESQLKVDDVCQIEQDKDGHYYCRDSVLAWSYVKDNNKVGDSIKIKEIRSNNNAKTRHKYPYFVIKYSNA